MRLGDITGAGIPVYGNADFRGKCPREDMEQITFFNWVRREYPGTWGKLALHPRNEGLREKGQFSSVIKHAAEGMTKGASDIVIPARISFVCELKRQDHTQSFLAAEQVAYLVSARAAGAFAILALGANGAREGFREWLTVQHQA